MVGEAANLGRRIRAAREDKGLSAGDLAEKAGCGEEYLEWVEDGQVEPPVALLLRLSGVLGLDSGAFLKDDDPEPRRMEATKRTEHYSYQNLTPESKDNHLMAFAVSIPPRTPHEGVGYKHEGEEFVYVVSGHVEVTVGQDRQVLGPKESIHFKSSLDHHLANPSDTAAEMLVILYVP